MICRLASHSALGEALVEESLSEPPLTPTALLWDWDGGGFDFGGCGFDCTCLLFPDLGGEGGAAGRGGGGTFCTIGLTAESTMGGGLRVCIGLGFG